MRVKNTGVCDNNPASNEITPVVEATAGVISFEAISIKRSNRCQVS